MAKRKTVDAYIKQANKACNSLIESGECKRGCFDIGYCDDVLKLVDNSGETARDRWNEEKWRFYPDG